MHGAVDGQLETRHRILLTASGVHRARRIIDVAPFAQAKIIAPPPIGVQSIVPQRCKTYKVHGIAAFAVSRNAAVQQLRRISPAGTDHAR
jgi:hypothetical protein